MVPPRTVSCPEIWSACFPGLRAEARAMQISYCRNEIGDRSVKRGQILQPKQNESLRAAPWLHRPRRARSSKIDHAFACEVGKQRLITFAREHSPLTAKRPCRWLRPSCGCSKGDGLGGHRTDGLHRSKRRECCQGGILPVRPSTLLLPIRTGQNANPFC